MNISKSYRLFFCLINICYLHNIVAMTGTEEKDVANEDKKRAVASAPLHKKIHRALAAMVSALDKVTVEANQVRDNEEAVNALMHGLVEEVINTPECAKKLGKLPAGTSYDFTRGLALAWAKIPDNLATATEIIRKLRSLRKNLLKYLLNELEFGSEFDKRMLGVMSSSKDEAIGEEADDGASRVVRFADKVPGA